MLDEDQSLGAMKMKIKVERAIRKGKLYDGIFHIDGTHGIVKNRFPLDVCGITDR